MVSEVIPCLFKSKQGVIDFFRGAGTPAPILAEWQSKVQTDRDAVKKHEIARNVLRRLNEGGDKTLAQRREVNKRISEFEDFSTCYDNDRKLPRTSLASMVVEMSGESSSLILDTHPLLSKMRRSASRRKFSFLLSCKKLFRSLIATRA
jgi:hypothetical protein